jgi:hypothetical protein
MLCSFSYLILLALRDILSYTYSKQAHFNAVVNQIRRNGAGGVEPTTAAMPATFYLRVFMERKIHAVHIPPGPPSCQPFFQDFV